MDIKYITAVIVGFITGISVNLAVSFSSSPFISSEPMPHVARYQYLMSFDRQPVDFHWAQAMEQELAQAFVESNGLTLNYVKCYRDVCAINAEVSQPWQGNNTNKLWQKVESALPEIKLQGLSQPTRIAGETVRLKLYQFARNT